MKPSEAEIAANRSVSEIRTGVVENDARADWSEAWALFPGDVAYVWHAGLMAGVVAAELERVGFDVRSQIIWQKQHFAMSRGHYHWGWHIFGWYFSFLTAGGEPPGRRRHAGKACAHVA